MLLCQGDDPLPHIPRLTDFFRVAEQHGGTAKGCYAHRFQEGTHGIGRSEHGAGAAGGAHPGLPAVKGLAVNGALVVLADGFLQIRGAVCFLPLCIGQHRACRQEQRRKIQLRCRHQHARHDLVAGAQKYNAVKAVGGDHGLDGCRDQVTLGQHVVHAAALGHTVAGSGNTELRRCAARCPDAFFHISGKLPQRFMAGVDIVPGVHHRNDRLAGNILLPVAGGAHQADEIGFGHVIFVATSVHALLLFAELYAQLILKDLDHAALIIVAQTLQQRLLIGCCSGG